MLTSILINQCQIITFLILKFDNIRKFKNRIERNSLPVPSNQIKFIFIIILPFNGIFVIFSCFTKKLKENVGGLFGGQRVCWAPLSNYWGAWPPGPLFLRLCNLYIKHVRLVSVVKILCKMYKTAGTSCLITELVRDCLLFHR